MRRNDKYAFFYLFALVPLSVVTAVWVVNGVPSQPIDLALVVFLLVFALVALRTAFRKRKTDYSNYRNQVGIALRERPEPAEKHIAELKHYIGELEKSSLALKHSREKYRHVAYHDSLTGLPNRSKFVQVIDQLLSNKFDSAERRFALLYLDLYRFKTINDSLGHAVGDELLRLVSSRLQNLVAPNDLVGRFNGDEFAILLPAVSGVELAETFANRVAEILSDPFVLNGRQIFTGVSIGIVISNPEYKSSAELLRDADIAMYRAKERKRRWIVFEKKMHVQALSLLRLETDLRLAVERDEFELFYQPIVELETTRFCGVEALLRWNHPQFGRINPEQFIEMCEATGLIVPITLRILESACLQINEWKKIDIAGADRLFVSVNVSGTHFAHPDIVEHVAAILTKTGISPQSLKLEITETAVMDNAERAATILRQIKSLGVQLSIDDFGTGYSSLSYLQQFPIDTLKIDRAFVRSMEDGRQNGEIVRAILALANAMNLSVIAEGIESIHELHQLRILNCRYGQGYLFSQPIPASEIEGLILNPTRWENLVSGSSFLIVPPSGRAFEERIH
jgi:diguanylate cyclase (GGDEF)-like protein